MSNDRTEWLSLPLFLKTSLDIRLSTHRKRKSEMFNLPAIRMGLRGVPRWHLY